MTRPQQGLHRRGNAVIRIRRPTIAFALLSAIYWMGVTGLWETITLLNSPRWLVMLTTSLPAMLYAVIALWFCSWLARRVMRQMATLQRPSNEAAE